MTVIRGSFAKDGIDIGDKRAIALQEWLSSRVHPASAEEIAEEMERLKSIMPAPEDAVSKLVFLPATACRDRSSCARHGECMYLGCLAYRSRDFLTE